MTRLPSDDWSVEVVRDPPYPPNKQCSVPGCWEDSEEAHHIWRRSFTGAPSHWVRIEGRKVGNVTRLCVRHHRMVTGGVGGHGAWIRWFELTGYGWWEPGVGDEWREVGLLDPMPPIGGWMTNKLEKKHDHEADVCPACGQVKRKPREKLPAGEARPKTKVVFTVPQDERENGAEVVATLMGEWKKVVHREHEHSDYYALVELLAFGVQHGHLLKEERYG